MIFLFFGLIMEIVMGFLILGIGGLCVVKINDEDLRMLAVGTMIISVLHLIFLFVIWRVFFLP